MSIQTVCRAEAERRLAALGQERDVLLRASLAVLLRELVERDFQQRLGWGALEQLRGRQAARLGDQRVRVGSLLRWAAEV